MSEANSNGHHKIRRKPTKSTKSANFRLSVITVEESEVEGIPDPQRNGRKRGMMTRSGNSLCDDKSILGVLTIATLGSSPEFDLECNLNDSPREL